MSKKDKNRDDDPGVSFTNMDVPGMPWNARNKNKPGGTDDRLQLTRKERRAAVWGMFLRSLPVLFSVIFGFTLTFLIVWLWLR